MATPITADSIFPDHCETATLIADRADSLKLDTAIRLGWLDQNRAWQLLGFVHAEVNG